MREEKTEVMSGNVSQETGPQGTAVHTQRGIGVSPSAWKSHTAPPNAQVRPRCFSWGPRRDPRSSAPKPGPPSNQQSLVVCFHQLQAHARSLLTHLASWTLLSVGQASLASALAVHTLPPSSPAGLASRVFSVTRILTDL